MSDFLIQTVLAARDNDGDTIWVQMLVLVVLAAALGIYSLVKTRAKKTKEIEQEHAEDTGRPENWRGRQIKHLKELKERRAGILASIKEPVLGLDVADVASQGKLKNEPVRDRGHDLHSGMELLELELLLSIVEDTETLDKNDITMRKLNFNELVRRQKQSQIDSRVLKVYALNEGNLFGKDIQCEAIKELARRTVYTKVNIVAQSTNRPAKARSKAKVGSSLFE